MTMATSNYQTGTPQETQVANGNAALIASAANSVNQGQTVTPDVAGAVTTAIGGANQTVNQLNTAGGRQPYLDNTNIASQQSNYDDLAKQLASYDNIVLQPQFAGSNPGAPSELNGLSGYVNPNLSYNSADARTPDQTIYNANPKYGLATQSDQGNSIVNLLGTLNKLLTNESARGTAKYTSDLRQATAQLSGLNDILRMNTDLTMKKAELEESRANRAQSRSEQSDREFYSAVSDGVKSLQTGEDWGTVWDRIKAQFPNKSDSEIDQQLGTTWKSPGAYEKYINKTVGAKTLAKVGSDDQDFKDVASGLDSYLIRRKGTGITERLDPTNSKGIAIQTERDVLSRIIAKLVEKNRISDSDAKFYINQLPAFWMNDEQSKSKIDGIKAALAAKLGVVNDLGSSNQGEWK